MMNAQEPEKPSSAKKGKKGATEKIDYSERKARVD